MREHKFYTKTQFNLTHNCRMLHFKTGVNFSPFTTFFVTQRPEGGETHRLFQDFPDILHKRLPSLFNFKMQPCDTFIYVAYIFFMLL